MFANVFLVCACVLLCAWVRVETTRLVTHAQVYQTSLAFRKELQAEQSSVVKTFEKRIATYEALSDKVVCVCVCVCVCVDCVDGVCRGRPPTPPYLALRSFSCILSRWYPLSSLSRFPLNYLLSRQRGAWQKQRRTTRFARTRQAL